MAAFEALAHDLRFALRSWRRAPVLACAVLSTLTIGIGANTAIFGVVSGILLRPLPFASPETLVQVYETQPRTKTQTGFDGPVVYRDFEEWRTHTGLFEGIITYRHDTRNLRVAGDPEQVSVIAAERVLFRFLGVAAFAGRTFDNGDPLGVAVASYGFWRDHIGADRSAIGRPLTLDGQSFTLIGVMPDGFQFPYGPARGLRDGSHDLWVPWEAPPDLRAHPDRRLDTVVGRL